MTNVVALSHGGGSPDTPLASCLLPWLSKLESGMLLALEGVSREEIAILADAIRHPLFLGPISFSLKFSSFAHVSQENISTWLRSPGVWGFIFYFFSLISH